jgi:hypothetical protein
MVFVLLTDENTLVVHANEQDAVRACEGVDVEDGVCVFFGNGGEPLRAVFDEPNHRGRFVVSSGRYHLAPDDGQRRNLVDLLPKIANIEGKGALRTLQDVQRLLTTQ